MQYTQPLSERTLECLSILKSPTTKEIRKQRKEDFIGPVGTYFGEIQSSIGISIHVLRKLLQNELYGVVGVFFNTLDVSHSVSRVPGNWNDDSILQEIYDRGYEPRFAADGRVFQAKTKRKHPRQKGLYIPETILEDYESSID